MTVIVTEPEGLTTDAWVRARQEAIMMSTGQVTVTGTSVTVVRPGRPVAATGLWFGPVMLRREAESL